MVVVLLTDLLVGVAVGFSLTMISHIANGVLLNSLFQPFLEVQEVDENTNRMVAKESVVFSNWIPFKQQILPPHHVTCCVETGDVVRVGDFTAVEKPPAVEEVC